MQPASPGAEALPDARIPHLSGQEIAALLEPMRSRLLEALPTSEVQALGLAAIGICRRLHAHARSRDAVPLANALLVQAGFRNDRALERRASTACGLLLADCGDIVGAIEHHMHCLRLAGAEGDMVGSSRVWNNLGLAFAIAGNYNLAMRCNLRALEEIRDIPGPVYSRYTACANAANGHFQLGEHGEGLRMGLRALRELSPEFLEEDPYGVVLLRRNLVYLLIATGRFAEAKPHVDAVATLAHRINTQRSLIAEATTRAAYEIATGENDIALTRLDHALGLAREIPGVLRDTLSCVIRGEEAAGQPDRALVRLRELAEHVYRFAIDRARTIIEYDELAALRETASDAQFLQTKARLVSKAVRREVPEGWDTLRRLAIGAALRVDSTGWHGMRVGALTKAHALAYGFPPLEALEIGLAAELHDIGLSSVPEALLWKRGIPNDVERALIRRHTDAGAEMLRDDRQPRMLMAREIARYHHARWDGAGYPERVGGNSIPLPARMCAVANAYDNFASGRTGREAVSMNEALERLRNAAGTEFDPDLVPTFEAMVRGQARDRRIDPDAAPEFESFQQLVAALEEDRGFI